MGRCWPDHPRSAAITDVAARNANKPRPSAPVEGLPGHGCSGPLQRSADRLEIPRVDPTRVYLLDQDVECTNPIVSPGWRLRLAGLRLHRRRAWQSDGQRHRSLDHPLDELSCRETRCGRALLLPCSVSANRAAPPRDAAPRGHDGFSAAPHAVDDPRPWRRLAATYNVAFTIQH